MWQHWHEEEDKDVDDDGPVYVMNQKTAIGHGIARVSGCLSQNIRVRGLPSGLPLHLRLLHQVLYHSQKLWAYELNQNQGAVAYTSISQVSKSGKKMA